MYRCYFIKVRGVSRKDFLHNKRVLSKTKKTPHCWKETKELAHIPIENIPIHSLMQYGSVNTHDIDGRKITIHNRLRQCLLAGYQTMLKVVNKKACADARKHKGIHNSPRFTNGTITIKA
jgi:hypothetical protein